MCLLFQLHIIVLVDLINYENFNSEILCQNLERLLDTASEVDIHVI